MSRAVRMTRAEAEALLGRKIGRTERGEGEVAASPPRVRRTASGPYHTVCTTCAVEFHTAASEDRHIKETSHANYRLVLGYTS